MVVEASVVSLHAAAEGGVPKPTVPVLSVRTNGCLGDRQRDLKHHGGPTRALCLWSREVLHALRAEGHPVRPGDVGETLERKATDEYVLAEGDVVQMGEVHARLTGPAPPCRTIAAAVTDGNFRAIDAKRHSSRTRWYAEVLVEGEVRPGDAVVLRKDAPTADR